MDLKTLLKCGVREYIVKEVGYSMSCDTTTANNGPFLAVILIFF